MSIKLTENQILVLETLDQHQCYDFVFGNMGIPGWWNVVNSLVKRGMVIRFDTSMCYINHNGKTALRAVRNER